MSKNNRKNVYNKPQKQGGGSVFGKLMMTIVIIGAIVFLFINYGYPKVEQGVKKIVAEKTVDVITKSVDKIAETNPEAAEIIESMSEEDKEVVTQIIENHIDAETVSEVMGYVQDGDKDAIIDYAAENLTPEEISQLIDLYGKYGSEIDIPIP